jgi:hypothetical protein
MNLDPKIWGPHYWNTFHFIAATYDIKPNPSIKSTMKNFIQSIPVFLPCKECQDHAFEYIKSQDLDKVVSSRMDLFTFFFNFHNVVNKRLNKPLMSMEDALQKYSYSNPLNSFNWTKWLFLIIILFILFLILKALAKH